MHPTGERLRCDECGAEVIFVQGCPCTDDPKQHSELCCGKEMRSLGVAAASAGEQPEAHPPH
jgi:hypothetical protein